MRNIYKIGDTIVGEEYNYTLTDKKQDEFGKSYFKYKCNICGYDCGEGYRKGKYVPEIWMASSQISRHDKCSCCAGKTTVSNINSIYAKSKESIKYFKNIQDSKTYTMSSNEKIAFKCPYCGSEKDMKISDFFRNGFGCPKCSDRISIGEKIIYCLLNELNVGFVKELSKSVYKWCEKYRYDFYVNETKTIIEVNGSQHKNGGFGSYKGGRTVKEEQDNDTIKKNIAILNGIEHYVVIDAEKSDFNFIKEAIFNSELNEMYNLNNIDWNKIHSQVFYNTLVKEVCDYWMENEFITRKEIKTKFHISGTTVARYLKIGNELGWCKYDSVHNSTHYDKPIKSEEIENATPIKCCNNNYYFKSASLCAKYSDEVFGKHIGDSTIRHKLKNPMAHNRKIDLDFTYVTKEEFNNAINNGKVVYGKPFKQT